MRRQLAGLLTIVIAALLLTAAPAPAADGGPPAGFDNARMVAEAGYDASGDVDLYLQRKRADGTWRDDIASGASGALDGERLESGRLQPGRYRIEVVNFAAPRGTKVDLRLTFFDSTGQPGA
jgi:hypothetical protein